MTLEGAIPKLQVKNLRVRVKNIQFKRRHRKTAAEKPVGGKYSVQKAPSQNCR